MPSTRQTILSLLRSVVGPDPDPAPPPPPILRLPDGHRPQARRPDPPTLPPANRPEIPTLPPSPGPLSTPHLRLDATPEPVMPPSGPLRIRLDALAETPEEANLHSIPLYRELKRRGMLKISVPAEIKPPAPAEDAPTEDAPCPAAPLPQAAPIALPTPPEGMAWISPRRIELHGHTLPIPGFFLDRYPVTNAEYRAFLLATGEVPPAHWFGDRHPSGQERHPATGVTLAQARRYAAWKGRRLPITAEWLSALHGIELQKGDRPDRPAFPWGDACDPSRCHCPRAGASGTAPVDAHPTGVTADGCMDMLGNAWEWTEPGEPGAANTITPPDPGTAYVLGSSYRHACGGPDLPWSVVPAEGDWLYLGFRCADHAPTAGGTR